jgi:hypothetical protein
MFDGAACEVAQNNALHHQRSLAGQTMKLKLDRLDRPDESSLCMLLFSYSYLIKALDFNGHIRCEPFVIACGLVCLSYTYEKTQYAEEGEEGVHIVSLKKETRSAQEVDAQDGTNGRTTSSLTRVRITHNSLEAVNRYSIRKCFNGVNKDDKARFG